jgi:tellurite resistance protein TehA-like permease
MGTGIVSILLHNLPWNGYWLHVISYIFFALNILLFTIFFTISFDTRSIQKSGSP